MADENAEKPTASADQNEANALKSIMINTGEIERKRGTGTLGGRVAKKASEAILKGASADYVASLVKEIAQKEPDKTDQT